MGATILEVARLVPDGLLVFMPSYSLLERLMQRWQVSNCGGLLTTSVAPWTAISIYQPYTLRLSPYGIRNDRIQEAPLQICFASSHVCNCLHPALCSGRGRLPDNANCTKRGFKENAAPLLLEPHRSGP